MTPIPIWFQILCWRGTTTILVLFCRKLWYFVIWTSQCKLFSLKSRDLWFWFFVTKAPLVNFFIGKIFGLNTCYILCITFIFDMCHCGWLGCGDIKLIGNLTRNGWNWFSNPQPWANVELDLCRHIASLGLSDHYSDVTMSAMASQITSISTVCSAVCSRSHQRKHQSSASLAIVMGIHRWPVGGFHSQRASNVENVPIWWLHHMRPVCTEWHCTSDKHNVLDSCIRAINLPATIDFQCHASTM